jgi:hypothetical protein
MKFEMKRDKESNEVLLPIIQFKELPSHLLPKTRERERERESDTETLPLTKVVKN